jgi:hypothetical protein
MQKDKFEQLEHLNKTDNKEFPYLALAEVFKGQNIDKLLEELCCGNFAMHAAATLLLCPQQVQSDSKAAANQIMISLSRFPSKNPLVNSTVDKSPFTFLEYLRKSN